MTCIDNTVPIAAIQKSKSYCSETLVIKPFRVTKCNKLRFRGRNIHIFLNNSQKIRPVSSHVYIYTCMLYIVLAKL